MLTFAQFNPGREIVHRMSRTLFASESALFSVRFHHHNPIYLDDRVAQLAGHPGIVINPYYVFNLVLGISVQDLTEHGGPFLGAEHVEFLEDLHDGDSVCAASVVVARRASQSRPGWGIVTWRTEGVSPAFGGQPVIRYTRSNLIPIETPDDRR